MRLSLPALAVLLAVLPAAAWSDAQSFSPAEEEELARGEVLTFDLEPTDGTGVAVRAVGLIEAPPAEVWPVLRDCEHYEEFLPATRVSALRSREGDVAVCYTEIDLPFPLSDLVSENRVVESRREDGGFERRWSLLSGSYRRNLGSWTLIPRGERTLAIYEVDIDLKTVVPRFLLRRAQRGTVPDVYDAVRERVRAAR